MRFVIMAMMALCAVGVCAQEDEPMTDNQNVAEANVAEAVVSGSDSENETSAN